MIKATTKKS